MGVVNQETEHGRHHFVAKRVGSPPTGQFYEIMMWLVLKPTETKHMSRLGQSSHVGTCLHILPLKLARACGWSLTHLKLSCKGLRTFDISKQISVEYGLLMKLSQVHTIWRGQKKHKAIQPMNAIKPCNGKAKNMLFCCWNVHVIMWRFLPSEWNKAHMTKKGPYQSWSSLPISQALKIQWAKFFTADGRNPAPPRMLKNQINDVYIYIY